MSENGMQIDLFCSRILQDPSLRTQTYFRLSFVSAEIFFGGDKRQPEIRLRSQATKIPKKEISSL